MAEAELRSIADGGTLRTLPSGLQIIRRRKHEGSESIEALSGENLRRQTDRIRGSKFLSSWTLAGHVDWIEEQLILLGWDRDTGQAAQTVELDEGVGYSNGKRTRKIRIELSSGCIHAYPVED